MKRYLIAAIAAIAIGNVGILIKLIGNSVPIMTVNFLRVFFALVFLGVVGLFYNRKIFTIKKSEIKFFALAGISLGVSMALFNTAFHYLTITHTYLLDTMFPFFILVFGGYFLKEGIRASDLMGLVIGGVGLAVLNPTSFKSQLGVSMVFAEVVLYALVIVYMKRRGMRNTLRSTFWLFFFASLFLMPSIFLSGLGNITVALPWLALLGFGCTGIGYLCFLYSINRIQTEKLNLIMLIGTTGFAIFMAVMFFGEVPPQSTLIGGALLVLGGSFIHIMRSRGHGKLSKIIYYAGAKRHRFLKRRK